MKKHAIFLSLLFSTFVLFGQTHIPASKSFVGIWRLSEGMLHGSDKTTGMFTVNNPDGTFYLFTTSGTVSTYASVLQYGTYEMTSDSTCTEKITKHMTNPIMDDQIILIKFRLIDENTMISQWKLGSINMEWMPEKWVRVP